MLLEFAESGHPIVCATSPLSRGKLKSKGHEKMSMHYCADLETIETIFRIIISVNQLSLYGAVAEMCEEYETLHDQTGQLVVGRQSSSSFVPSVTKTEVPLDCDDLAHKDLLLQQCGERTEKLSQQDKNSHNSVQWPVVGTLVQETKKHHNQKDGSKETSKLDPYWKLQYVTCTVSTEVRSELCLQTETILTPGSEFLMDQTSL